ncbi:epigen [Neoarius graeffei]|uniref:epigen n=1 Tax=Neoarius graeffei TaxID=443677 RepID=UPI00298C22F8|nr:epigen [Neoarius graeffei]
MLQCVEKPLCFAVVALASVSLLYSRTVEGAETKLQLKLNSTRSLNITHSTHNEPGVRRLCSEEHQGYCINGLCLFPEDINTPSCKCVCRCNEGYRGERCEHRNLSVGAPKSLEEAIAISCGVILLLTCVCVLGACCCYRKWGSKPAPPYKNQANNV